ncbi:MAG: DUF885 family protein [Saprospiraceae bacterium]
MKLLAPLLLFLFFSFQLVAQPTTTEKLTYFFEQVEAFDKHPQDSLYRGLHPRGEWSANTDEKAIAKAESYRDFLEVLGSFSAADLTRQEQISQTVMQLKLQDQIDNIDYRMHLIPFNAEGGFYSNLSYVMPKLPFERLEDYEAYLGWIPSYASSLRQNTDLMRQGLKEGIISPKPIASNILGALDTWAPKAIEDSPLFEPFARLHEGFSDESPVGLRESSKKELIAKGKAALQLVNKEYSALRTFVKTEYLPAAPEKPGVGFLPKGQAYYENRIQYYTTLPLTADSVHQLGLQEVARIRTAMEGVIKEVNFEGSFAEFIAFLRTDEQFYAKTPEELLRRAAWISKQAEGQLPKLFNKLYSLPFTVAPVPASLEKTYTGGRYVPGSWKQKRPGTYWVNTYDLKSRTLYTLPALTVHEAVPGHHLQGALAAEIKGIPPFRNRYYISAFGEGWGLYSEFLGEEMGIYTTPYELFGRYTYEMWRACRLVIDTGIHSKGWSREKAQKYLAENTALSLHEVHTEIDRYIAWPGQAVSYKIGELQIKHLREVASTTLGDKFDLRAFHAVVLKNGSVPLGVLEAEVMDWVAGVE